MLFPASFKLALMCCSCLHHILPWVASCSFVMHHACCASCLVHVWCVYYVVCFFSIVPVSLRSWGFVCLRLVRLRGFIFFMDSFFFLAGFQARWPLPWISLLSLLCSLLRSIALLRYLSPLYQAIPNCHEPLTFDTLPRKPLLGYVTALLSPSYSVASCRWSWRLLHGGHDFVGISQYLLFN